MSRGSLITLATAVIFVAVALASVLLPPVDLLERLRSGIYTAYFNWGLISADGSHAYAEVYGYQIALNLWRIAICDPNGACQRQSINAISLYLQLKASGKLVIQPEGFYCYDVTLKPVELANHTISFSGVVCLAANGAPQQLEGTLTIDGRALNVSGKPYRVEDDFLMDRFMAVYGG